MAGPYRFIRHPMYSGLIQLHQSLALPGYEEYTAVTRYRLMPGIS
jgi:hypothetical protein